MAKDDKFIPKASIGESEDNNGKMDRKSFIQWLSIGWLAFAAATGGFFTVMIRFLFPNVLFEPPQSFKIGYPADFEKGKVDLSNITSDSKKIISIFPGSRLSEINVLMPILIDFIKLMNMKYNNYLFVFHSINENKNMINDKLKYSNLNNVEAVSNEKIKSEILSKSVFAVSKSGTVSLEICNAEVPSIIIYKMNFFNFLIIKLLVKVKFANIINIINEKEVIPELLQSRCNSEEIFNMVNSFLENPQLIKNQIESYQKTLKEIKSEASSTDKTADILIKSLS